LGGADGGSRGCLADRNSSAGFWWILSVVVATLKLLVAAASWTTTPAKQANNGRTSGYVQRQAQGLGRGGWRRGGVSRKSKGWTAENKD
jgi:hypothetical protein